MKIKIRSKYNWFLLVGSIFSILLLVGIQVKQQGILIQKLATEEIHQHMKSAWSNFDKRKEMLQVAAALYSDRVSSKKMVSLAKSIDYLFSVRENEKLSGIKQYLSDVSKNLVLQKAVSGFLSVPCSQGSSKCSYERDIFLVAFAPSVDERKTNIAAINLTRDNAVVDEIVDTVFSDEKYESQMVGSVTIFSSGLRAKTTILNAEGNRAIGTEVSKEVFEKVMRQSLSWVGEALVVSDLYYTRYDPIRDLFGETVGMLYVGKLKKYVDSLKKKSLLINSFVTVLIIVIVFFALSRVFSKLLSSLDTLTSSMNKICEGDLNQIISVSEHSEIEDTVENFNKMAIRLQETQEDLVAQKDKLLSANHNYMDLMNFMAIDLKNRLSSAYLNIELLLDGTYGEISADQQSGVNIIKKNITHIQNDIVSYLEVTNASDGRLMIERSPVNLLHDSLGPAIEHQKEKFSDLHVEWLVKVPENLIVAGDPNLLKILFRNCLLNFYHNVETDQVIEVSALEVKGLAIISMSVRLREKALSTIDAIFQGEEEFSEEEAKRANGVGTFILNQIVTQHGGKIWIEHEKGGYISLKISLQT